MSYLNQLCEQIYNNTHKIFYHISKELFNPSDIRPSTQNKGLRFDAIFLSSSKEFIYQYYKLTMNSYGMKDDNFVYLYAYRLNDSVNLFNFNYPKDIDDIVNFFKTQIAQQKFAKTIDDETGKPMGKTWKDHPEFFKICLDMVDEKYEKEIREKFDKKRIRNFGNYHDIEQETELIEDAGYDGYIVPGWTEKNRNRIIDEKFNNIAIFNPKVLMPIWNKPKSYNWKNIDDLIDN